MPNRMDGGHRTLKYRERARRSHRDMR
jgi:hypothetical protein